MRYLIQIAMLILLAFQAEGQNCPIVDYRNNGNGQANSCPNVNGTPMATNFEGTPYANNFTGLSKSGSIRLVLTGIVTTPPAIKHIWIGNTVSSVVVGPASVPETVNGNTRVSYCFYGSNLPNNGVYSLELVNPQTDAPYSLCGFDGPSNDSADPPLILAQPQSQSVCDRNNLTLSVSAQAAYGGTLSYQWKKNGVDIAGATAATYAKVGVDGADTGNYTCLVGESLGTFILSDTASIQIINCASNTYLDACGSGGVVTRSTDSWGAAWVDFDNDGLEDIYVCDKSGNGSNALYKNKGNAVFELVSGSALSSISAQSVNSAWADYDHDGLKDVYIANATGDPGFLYKNIGGGNFQRKNNAGLVADPQYAHGAVWCDFNLDGYVDLFVTSYFETHFHQLYKNNRDGTFTQIESGDLIRESNRALAPILCDYNKDGLTDIFIPNGNNQPNSLFRNLGDFQFEKITSGAIVTDAFNSVGASWGDYNNDGWPDLFVCNASGQNNNLYKNNGDGTFTSISGTPLVQNGGHSHGANWIDIDNDADLDLFVTNDQGPNFLYINHGSGNFSRIMDEAIATDLGLTNAQAWADYNKDGRLDLIMNTHSGQKDFLYCGKANNKHWINIKLVGVASNPDAIGAKISLLAGGQWQYRQNHPVSGFGSQNSLRQHFGLNTATTITTIEVLWPSGYKQVVSNIQADQFLTITEEPGNLITGFAFSDDNHNCIWNQGEDKLEGIQFKLTPSGTKFASGDDGEYSQRVGPGSYTIQLESNSFWNMTCPASVNFSGSNNTSNLNLPLSRSQDGYDLHVSSGVSAWRRGFAGAAVLQCSNDGTSNATQSKVELTYPDGIDLKWSSVPWDEEDGNKYTWNISELKGGETWSVQLRDSVKLGVSVGDELTLSSHAGATGQDLREENNTCQVSERVVGAIDPNDLQVSPRGKGDEGFIPKDQVLRYQIRFQNVGTYAASTVVLENPLSSFLDWNTFKIEAASHSSYTYSLNERGILIVRFNNIELPDSTTDEPGSHGFFIYSIQPKASLIGGERITNNVTIAFDYEDPLTSNTVVNTIRYGGKPEERNLIIYPNPAVDQVELMGDAGILSALEIPLLHTVKIFSATGVLVRELKNADKYIIPVNISLLPEGLYGVTGYDANGRVYHGKLLKQQ